MADIWCTAQHHSFDVGVDRWGFGPINLETVRQLMAELATRRKSNPKQPLRRSNEALKP